MTSKEIFIDARLTQHNRRCAGCQMVEVNKKMIILLIWIYYRMEMENKEKGNRDSFPSNFCDRHCEGINISRLLSCVDLYNSFYS